MSWKTELVDYVNSRKEMPFEWGVNDCMLFLAGGVKIKSGDDHAPDFTHKSAKEAFAYTKGDVDSFIDGFGYERVHVNLAQFGDAVTSHKIGEKGRSLGGICMGANSYFIAEHGAVHIPTIQCDVAWRIPVGGV